MQQRHFDQWQQEAIEISEGRHVVLAPPGCGKTDILTERVVYAHASGIAYSDMLCLTFTNRAAKGMAQRIADRTGNPVPDDLYVGNIHRFCSQLLFNQGIVSQNSAIIDEGDTENIIQEELCKRLNTKSRTTELVRLQHGLLQMALGMRGDLILHRELFRAASLAKVCDVLQRPFDENNLAAIYSDIENLMERYSTLHELPAANMMLLAKTYEHYKTENDLLDYDDLLVKAYQYLASPPAPLLQGEGSGWQSKSSAANHQLSTKRYRWIEVDEVQDLNPLQLALIDLLAADDATIVYLGDEQQAIFSFIGAKLETLKALKQRSQLHHLHSNYRSPKYLLDLQNDFAMRNLGIARDMLPDTGNNPPHNPEDLCLLNVVDAQLQSYYTVRFAKRYGDLDPENRVALLVSTNREADELSDTMAAMGVKHFKISGTDLFSLPAVRMLLAHITVVADENVFIAWARLFWGLGITPSYTTARDLMRDLRRTALLPSDFLHYSDSSYLQEFVKAYSTEELVIFDTETTGLDTETDDIVQIAAIKVRQGKVTGKPFNILLETDRELPATVGGHPNPMLEVYRNGRHHTRPEGLRLFMEYCGGRTLVGHNVGFDYRILEANLQRCCPDISLRDRCPNHFDTLKYIRLVRPRLRNYKLAHLLETLHLEGQNSHRADDDILATKHLLDFCHRCAVQLTAPQQLFLKSHSKEISKFRERYAEAYLESQHQPGLVEAMETAYTKWLATKHIEPVEKWKHLIHYLRRDLIRTDLYPTLHQQLERYTNDLCTLKEADLCSNSLEEQFIISTVHKAKGLEFDTVIVYRAIDGNYPGSRSWTETQIQEDARRLFVALSRSRKRLCITTDEHHGRSLHTLSPFLEKLRSHFVEYRRGNDGKIQRVD